MGLVATELTEEDIACYCLEYLDIIALVIL